MAKNAKKNDVDASRVKPAIAARLSPSEGLACEAGGVGILTHGNPHELHGIAYDISEAFFALRALVHHHHFELFLLGRNPDKDWPLDAL